MYYIFAAALGVTIFLGWELYRAPTIEDERTSFDDVDDPTTTCWDDDYNHTEGDFH